MFRLLHFHQSRLKHRLVGLLRKIHLPLNPCHQHGHRILLLLLGQLSAGAYMVPFFKATATAATCGVLSKKNGMPSHRGLSSIIRDVSRSQPFGYKILRMPTDSLKTFRHDIVTIFFAQMKPAAKVRPRQTFKEIGQVILHTR